MRELANSASNWIVPLLILAVPLYAYAVKRIRVYESFIEGAKEGFTIGVRIMPYLVAILVAIGMFRASGAMDALVWIIRPLTEWAGFPPEALPSSLMRSLSGSAAFAMSSEIFKQYGPDSFIGRL
ncbi:MAG: spore maturation protein, partial [Gemmatimonadaceae bacterium]|nr:spore maturation protein [Gemmatimonadaceae bacterium]